ncbi:P-loop containing nucleoside triphosphate hydrolase protein [Stachybotrys elegans]|uniref:P-loop containing nucleoside triphosphate hydrolase protein n=1 Tax=Stachybotrys elegans TaxID=80388 RepID=A0A8K0SGY7_9HYPO|nr:P-loop containing nucleoside triphosphate hydrolase protein [Stachybotrys elegans]
MRGPPPPRGRGPYGPETDDESISDGEENSGEEKIFVGIVAESKELYAKFDKDRNRSWSHSPPDGLEEAAENEKTLKYAILVRKAKPKEADSLKPLVIESIVVQSPYLKQVLGQVFRDYPGVVTNVSRLIFSAPFEPFVHSWSLFVKIKNDSSHDEDTKTHLTLLYDILHTELKEVIQNRKDYFKNRAVPWDQLWTIFPPKTTVLTSIRDKPMAVRFEDGQYREPPDSGKVYRMTCDVLDWDGRKMGWGSATQTIREYEGTKPFDELPCCPFEYSSNAKSLREMLVARGRRFQSLAGINYKYYDGIAVNYPPNDPRQVQLEPVSGRVVIDAANWGRANPAKAKILRSLHQAYEAGARYRPPPPPELSEDQLILTSPVVRGYSLMAKKWMEFFVDDISDVSFDGQAFSSLVLEEEKKRLILAFAQSQVKNKAGFDDVISGKGRGIIIMLTGGPGIGKTLTAESVAEEMRVPLYTMSAGDLGSDSDMVERNLSRTLDMVAKWGAVLLLDECDIFLEQRTSNDMERNQVVGIFLRMLEYYQGILFLTTNRVKDIDPAFHSRIHLTLAYPELDREARARIWRTFLKRITVPGNAGAGHRLTEDEVSRLSKLELNGRQIKNVLKMASLLPLQAAEALTFDHVCCVLRIQGFSL